MHQETREIPAPFEGWRLCGHCMGHGTCRAGRNGNSCYSCNKNADEGDPQSERYGLPCSICSGHGCSAPNEVKTNKLMGAWVTIICSGGAFLAVLLSGFFFSEHLDKILTFAGTIIGSITGFYFGGRSKQPKGEL